MVGLNVLQALVGSPASVADSAPAFTRGTGYCVLLDHPCRIAPVLPEFQSRLPGFSLPLQSDLLLILTCVGSPNHSAPWTRLCISCSYCL
jgi:hypothetical protein